MSLPVTVSHGDPRRLRPGPGRGVGGSPPEDTSRDGEKGDATKLPRRARVVETKDKYDLDLQIHTKRIKNCGKNSMIL